VPGHVLRISPHCHHSPIKKEKAPTLEGKKRSLKASRLALSTSYNLAKYNNSAKLLVLQA
jgi:hypothetical protein